MQSCYKEFTLLSLLFIFSIWHINLHAQNSLFLKDNLQRAQSGDYIVVSSNKTDTLMHIYDKQDQLITIEEIAVPESERKSQSLSWREWIHKNAPSHTSWVMYEIDLQTGQMQRYYSFSKQGWFEIPDADNFLSKLLNLKLNKLPDQARKKVGPRPNSGPDMRVFWQPRMIVDGQVVKGVEFNVWQTQWPRDGSELSGKSIEIYLPQDSQCYPSYFPYWLQVIGAVGKAKVRIIDSGSHLNSPKPPLSALSS
jgi:hypothetical protein